MELHLLEFKCSTANKTDLDILSTVKMNEVQQIKTKNEILIILLKKQQHINIIKYLLSWYLFNLECYPR